MSIWRGELFEEPGGPLIFESPILTRIINKILKEINKNNMNLYT